MPSFFILVVSIYLGDDWTWKLWRLKIWRGEMRSWCLLLIIDLYTDTKKTSRPWSESSINLWSIWYLAVRFIARAKNWTTVLFLHTKVKSIQIKNIRKQSQSRILRSKFESWSILIFIEWSIWMLWENHFFNLVQINWTSGFTKNDYSYHEIQRIQIVYITKRKFL